MVEQGQAAEGLSQIREAIAAARTTGAGVGTSPWLLATLAEACGQAGQSAEGLRALEEALERVQAKEEHLYESEVYRLKGEMLLQQSTAQQGEAEEHLQQALAVARRQQARSWELRVATSLSRLWQQ